jgi:hypothetical protein
MQWRQEVLRMSNEILAVLPPELKRDVETITRPTFDMFGNYDPSESIHSGDVFDLTHMFFDVVSVYEIGFTITHVVLNPILRFYDDDNPAHTANIRLIFLMEELLIADLLAFARPGAQLGRERLAVSPPELALKHCLRKLRRDPRDRMRCLAKAHCPTPKRSRPSECATGLTSVTRYDLWYEVL